MFFFFFSIMRNGDISKKTRIQKEPGDEIYPPHQGFTRSLSNWCTIGVNFS